MMLYFYYFFSIKVIIYFSPESVAERSIYGRCLAAYHVYLKCTSMHNGEWECKVDCQIKVRCLRCKSPILFSSNTDGKLSFEVSSNRPLVRLGCLYKDCSSHKTREFTVKFISIQTKVHGK